MKKFMDKTNFVEKTIAAPDKVFTYNDMKIFIKVYGEDEHIVCTENQHGDIKIKQAGWLENINTDCAK